MNLFYIVEIIVTLIVLFFQIKYFLESKRKINELELVFPERKLGSDLIEIVTVNEVKVELVKENASYFTPSFKDLLGPINQYLLKNKGAVDFAIIKSIVERYVEAKENAIASSISLPLYIGLMGTFVGIILGLFKIAFFGGVSDENINSFLGGIFIAMVASLCGLILTVINNSGNLKNAKSIIDSRKNDFYNFLQVELLPHLGNSLYDALDRLKNNINEFNEKFSSNVKMFDTNFTSNIWHLKNSVESIADNINPIIENTNSQKEFLRELRAIGYNRMAEANMKVFSLMKEAGPNFVQFIESQKGLNDSITKTASFVNTIESVLNRVKTFEDSINKLGERIDNADYMSSDLLKKVEKKMSDLDMQFEVLKQHSQRSNGEINDFFESEYGRVKDLVGHIKNEIERALDFNIDNNPFQKLNLLDKLEDLKHLDTLTKDSSHAAGKTELIATEILGQKESIKRIEEHLASINKAVIEIKSESNENGSNTNHDPEPKPFWNRWKI